MLIKNIRFDTWVDVNTVASVNVGTRFKLFNVSIHPVLVVESATQPSADYEDGTVVVSSQPLVVEGGADKIWMRTISESHSGEIFVESTSLFSYSDNGIDQRVYTGLQGITTQPFVEINAKNGTQFEAASYLSSLPANGSVDTIITTGSLPVLIKGFDIIADGAGVTVTLYESPTFSGGVTVNSYNLSAASSNTSLSVVLAGVTTTDVGVQKSSTITILGVKTPGNSKSSPSTGLPGLDRVLKPNTTYLRRITSIDSSETQRLSLYTTWYEGPLSTEI